MSNKKARRERLALLDTINFVYRRSEGHPLCLTAIGIDKDGIYRMTSVLKPDDSSMNKRASRINAVKNILSGDCSFYTEFPDGVQEVVSNTPEQFKCFKSWVLKQPDFKDEPVSTEDSVPQAV